MTPLRILCPDVHPIDVDTHDAALKIAQRDRIAFYDALIVASARWAASSMLLTDDMQDNRVIDGRLTIRNPFRSNRTN